MSPIASKNFKFFSLILIFALPAIIAAGVYWGRGYLELTPQSNGLLLNPPLAIEKLNIETVNGTALTAKDFAKSWWLIYVAPPECGNECAVQAGKLRSVHMALNKNIPRVKRLMLIQAHSLPANELQQAQQDTQLMIYNVQNPEYLLNDCSVATQEGIFVMDPLGNIMLCYGPQQEAHLILKDIEKLLKASRIG